MQNHFAFTLKANADSDFMWKKLETLGWMPLYATQDAHGMQQIIAQWLHPKAIKLDLNIDPNVAHAEPIILPTIDWKEQWTHSQYYQDGLFSLDLADFGQEAGEPLILDPGPGFGDLSHSTTRLVLRMMASYVKNRTVLDIGCGSGILSLAAAKWNAKKVIALEICPEALEHAKMNAQKNGLEKQIDFVLTNSNHNPLQLSDKDPLIIVMNMISSEQELALRSLPKLLNCKAHWMISGILTEQKEKYFKTRLQRGWQHVETMEEDGWLAMHFIRLLPKLALIGKVDDF